MTGRMIVMALTLISLGFSFQGCMAVVWVTSVGLGSTVNGSVEFQRFENSQVVSGEFREARGPINSIAIAPFHGDTTMAGRFSSMFEQSTSLQVVPPRELIQQSAPVGHLVKGFRTPQEERPRLARYIAGNFGVDCVLFGTVVGVQSRNTAGDEEAAPSKRLYLHLVDAEGSTLWKDELPFTVVQGLQPLPEKWYQQALNDHVMAHVRTLGLTALAPTGGQG